MSISHQLKALLSAGKLVELPSLFTGYETARTMIVSQDVYAAVLPPFPDTDKGRRRAEMRGWLDNFSEHGEFTVAENPDRKPHDAMLARVRPVEAEFWSMRITAPDDTPGIRVIGCFALVNTFIAIAWEYREHMDPFDDHVNDAIQAWGDLFGECPPFMGAQLYEYLTNFRPV